MSKIREQAEVLAKPVAEKLGLTLYEIEYKKEGADWHLTFYIDKEGGVDLNDCETFSHEMSDILDANDPIESNYILTVSSPGIERRLTQDWHYTAVVGSEIEVKLFAAKDGEKRFSGILLFFENGVITLQTEDHGKVEIKTEEVSAAKTVYHF